MLILLENHRSIGLLLRISVNYLHRETFQSNEARLELLVGDIPGSLSLWPNSLGMDGNFLNVRPSYLVI